MDHRIELTAVQNQIARKINRYLKLTAFKKLLNKHTQMHLT